MSPDRTSHMKPPKIIFNLASTTSPQASPNLKFGPRLGTFQLHRNTSPISASPVVISIPTPGVITSTSRGVVPHLSQDHISITQAIQWIQVPFETYLERPPPIPTIQGGLHPLHSFLGFPPHRHILSMSLRDPFDAREMPPNGNGSVNAHCIRGVRKVTPASWREYVLASNPDLVVALSDIPFTPSPFSQKRITKSLDRSVAWLSSLLQPVKHPSDSATTTSQADSSNISPPNSEISPNLNLDSNSNSSHPLNILVHMVGDTIPAARHAFSASLIEKLHGKEGDQIKPLQCLDEGISGYVFDLVPLRLSILANENMKQMAFEDLQGNRTEAETKLVEGEQLVEATSKSLTNTFLSRTLPSLIPLLQSSLFPLPTHKLRLINSPGSPHEILHLIRDIGIDLFDTHWAQKAADWGVALDFKFPVPKNADVESRNTGGGGKLSRGGSWRGNGMRDLGHNLYDLVYARDFSRFAECFLDGSSASVSCRPNNISTSNATMEEVQDEKLDTCPCAACSPVQPTQRLRYSSIDDPSPHSSFTASTTQTQNPDAIRYDPPFNRAYVHHLLHTHEMSAHALLAMHNLSVFEAFFAGIRKVLSSSSLTSVGDNDLFSEEISRFCSYYDPSLQVFEEAKKAWIEVDHARGKGRLAREKAKQAEMNSETKVEMEEDMSTALEEVAVRNG